MEDLITGNPRLNQSSLNMVMNVPSVHAECENILCTSSPPSILQCLSEFKAYHKLLESDCKYFMDIVNVNDYKDENYNISSGNECVRQLFLAF